MTAKKKRGRPAHEVSEKNKNLVKFARIAGVTNENICEMLGITSVNTLKKYYKPELEMGEAEINAKVVNQLFNEAMNGSVPSLIFWAKARMGWSDKGAVQQDKEIVVTVKRSENKHDPDAIERALLDESEF